MASDYSRRSFVGDTAKLAFGAMIVPRFVLGGKGYRAPSDKLNIACVGIGGMGMSNMSQMLGENLVAMCDVDFPYVERALSSRLRPSRGEPSAPNVQLGEQYKKATKYADYRVMFDKQKDIDAVLIATPDHMHASIANMAMKMGKHVYVQKPLTYSVYEARLLAKTAAESKVVTQMGNQGHSGEGTRRINEIVASGVLGKIHEVHVWTDRPVRYWAQGIPRPIAPGTSRPYVAPEDPNVPRQWNQGTVDRAVRDAMAINPSSPPPGLDWNLFLGCVPDVPYHPAYHPFAWRGWLDFCVGAIGDMGAHLIDQSFWALGLDYPTSIAASSSPWGGGAQTPATYPMATTVQYEFAARGKQPPVKMYWYDGGLIPPRPDMLPTNAALSEGDGGGGLIIGEKGILTHETYGNNVKIYPEAAAVPKTFARVTTSHEVNWIQACKGEAKASCPIDYAAKLTETMLLGIVALRTGQGKKLLYDGPNMKVTNIAEANQYLTRAYRKGWEL
jgi:predicted dehydrogenase